MKRLVIETSCADETRQAGCRLGRALGPGDVIGLCGPLGAGKTVFVQGLARGLSTDPRVLVTSPGFVILHEYPGPVPLYHFDFYRLGAARELRELGLEEYFEADGVCAVEWADKFPALFGAGALEITFTSTGENTRRLVLQAGKALNARWSDIQLGLAGAR